MATWVKFHNDFTNAPVVMNLDEAIAFELQGDKQLCVFFHEKWFRITQKRDPELYRWLFSYIQSTTGQTLP